MKRLIALALLLGLTGCTIEQKPKADPTSITVDRKELCELTYEWSMYKELAILGYAKVHGCSKEDSAAHLEYSIKYATQKKFIADVEFRDKWERRK